MADPPGHPFDEIFEQALKRARERHDPNAQLLRFDRDQLFGDQIIAMVEYSLKVDDPKLKQQSMAFSIRFLGDRAEIWIMDLSCRSFLYADPKFPGNMYRQI